MTENTWNRTFKGHLSTQLRGDIWKVNDRITPGISDFVLFLNDGRTVFLESKRPTRPFADPTDLLSGKQHQFLLRRARQGFAAYVVVSRPQSEQVSFYQMQDDGRLELRAWSTKDWATVTAMFAHVCHAGVKAVSYDEAVS